MNNKSKKYKTVFDVKRGKGEILLADGTYANITIPEDKSILSIVGLQCKNGMKVSKDGWIYYSNGTRKKWFDRVVDSDARVWTPRFYFENLKKPNPSGILEIHRIFKRTQVALDKSHTDLWNFAAILFKTKKNKPHVPAENLTHKHSDPGEKSWWQFRIEEYEDRDGTERMSYGFDWVKPPNKPKHVKEGIKFYQLKERNMVCLKRYTVAKNILYMAIRKLLGPVYNVNINDVSDIILIHINDDVFRAWTEYNYNGALQWVIADSTVKLNKIVVSHDQIIRENNILSSRGK